MESASTPATTPKKSPLTAILAVLIIVAGVGGFYGGIQYQKGKQSAGGLPGNGTFVQRMGNMNINGVFPGRNTGFGNMIRGEVTSISGSNVTVKDSSGSSRIVILSSSTTYTESTAASAGEVTIGTTIAATGTSNSDGSVTATTVQINPAEVAGGQATPAQ